MSRLEVRRRVLRQCAGDGRRKTGGVDGRRVDSVRGVVVFWCDSGVVAPRPLRGGVVEWPWVLWCW